MWIRTRRHIPAIAFTAAMACAAGFATPVQAASDTAAEAAAQINVVYHINDSDEQTLRGLRSMRNHLDVAPNTQIVVVAHGDGIDFLTNDYDEADTVGPLVGGLASRGVVFEVCEITMASQGLTHDDFLLEADFTPSGVARLAQLQAEEGYVYIRP